MTIAAERGNLSFSNPEKNVGVSFVPVPQLDLAELATKTHGAYRDGLVVWGPENGVANGELVRKIKGSHSETKKTFFYLRCETFRDEVSKYTAVYSKDNSVALIDATNPVTNTIYGFVIKDRSIERIMGNEGKFAEDHPEYIEARNIGWIAKLEAAKINN